jgi:hypothetical protein
MAIVVSAGMYQGFLTPGIANGFLYYRNQWRSDTECSGPAWK